MELKQQVCSLELSKKLKELGMKQNSLYSYVCHKARQYSGEKDWWLILETSHSYNFKGDDIASAFTVAELGEMLPGKIRATFLSIIKMDKGTWVVQYCEEDMNTIKDFGDINLCNAIAMMEIYLIENKVESTK